MEIVAVDKIPPAENVPLEDPILVLKICTQMEKVCSENDGVGISAVQVGIPWKLFIILKDKDKLFYEYYVNCEYKPIRLVGEAHKSVSIEGCLSLRDDNGKLRRFEVERYKKVRIEGKKLVCLPELEFSDVDMELEGYYSIVYQHEIQHHHGVLVSDIGKEIEIH